MGLGVIDKVKVVDDMINLWDLMHPIQRVRKLKIEPRPTSVIFRFRTLQPTVPVIEIFRNVTNDPKKDMRPDNAVAVAFDFIAAWLGNLTQDHVAVMQPLGQGERFHYRITAGNGQHPAAVVTGTFSTGFRSARFFVRDIAMLDDGDGFASGAGELVFEYAIYNGNDKMTDISNYQEIDTGELRQFPMGKGYFFQAGQIEDRISIFLHAVELDRDLFGPFYGLTGGPPTVPTTLTASDDGDEVVAESLVTLDMPQVPGDYRIGFKLDSGPKGIHYWVTGWVDVRVEAPKEMPVIPIELNLDFKTGPKITTKMKLKRAGAQGIVAGTDGRRHAFAIGPEGELLRRLPGEAWEKLKLAEVPIDEDEEEVAPLAATVMVDSADRIHLLAEQGGMLRHASYAAGRARARSAALRWRDLGQGWRAGYTIASAADGAAWLFARNCDRRLLATSLTGGEAGRWIDLGVDLSAAPAVTAGKRGFEICGIATDGSAVTGLWRAGSTRVPAFARMGRLPAGTRLRRLGVAEAPEGVMAVALTTARELLTLARNGDGWAGTWKSAGSIDSFGGRSRPVEAVVAAEPVPLVLPDHMIALGTPTVPGRAAEPAFSVL